jgi:rRNA maturation endonuclease Nob1
MRPFNYENYTKSGVATFKQVKNDSEKYEVEIEITQQVYQCLNCEHEIPIAIKFCPECGARYTIQYKN